MGERRQSTGCNPEQTRQLEEIVKIRELLEEQERLQNRTFLWDFSTEVTADAGNSVPNDEVRITIPYDGIITQLIIGWGEGSNQATGVKFKSATGEKFVPRNDDGDAEFIGMNDHVLPPIPLNVPVQEGEEFIAEYKNNDDQNSHFVNCEAYIRELPEDQ